MKSLGNALAETQHISPLSRKMKRLGFPSPDHLIQLAIHRGCTHYRRPGPTIQDPGTSQISNAELIAALLLSQNPYNPDLIRIAGQLLGAEPDPRPILKLAKQERFETCLRHIALQGTKLEPHHPLWQSLLQNLPDRHPPNGILPHSDRFTSFATFTPRNLRSPPQKIWLRPQTV